MGLYVFLDIYVEVKKRNKKWLLPGKSHTIHRAIPYIDSSDLMGPLFTGRQRA